MDLYSDEQYTLSLEVDVVQESVGMYPEKQDDE
jgi:hypothetical protein